MAPNISSKQDTGWGVIYRLNGLFSEVEELSPSGEYDQWNIKLDRIWSNLVYRNALEWEIKDDKIVGVKFSDEDFAKKDFLDNNILKCKSGLSISIRNSPPEQVSKTKEYILAKRKLYQSLMLKEIWLKKYMHQLGLYLKETSHNPAGAMWGK